MSLEQQALITSTKLKVEKYAMNFLMPLEVVEVDALLGYHTEAMLVRLSKFVLTEDKAGEVVQYPHSTWDHFKQDYAPKWFLRHFPVKYIKHTISFKVKYPDYKLSRELIGRGYVEFVEYKGLKL